MKAFYALCAGRAGTCLGTMAFAGALPTIRSEWQLDAAAAGTVQTVFSITNALALFGASWLCDRLGPRKVYLLFAWLGVVALLLFAGFARTYPSALLLMAFVGLTQGGVYTPALMLAMAMNSPAKRGLAVGLMLAAGSLGYLLSVFIASWSAAQWGVQAAFWLCAAGTLAGAIFSSLALAGHADRLSAPDGRRADKRLPLTVASALLLIGYIAHCWELLGSWAWTPSLVAQALEPLRPDPLLAGMAVAVTVHLSGMFATLLVGAVSDYFNRISVLIFMGAAGAASSLLMGFSPAWGTGWTLAIGFMGSFFILGDSGVLSAAIADSVPARHLGKVMGIRSLAGFGIGSFAPLSFGMVMDATHRWVLAYATLSAGGAIACVAAAGLLWHTRSTV